MKYRNEILEEAARECERIGHKEYPLKLVTDGYVQAIRSLKTSDVDASPAVAKEVDAIAHKIAYKIVQLDLRTHSAISVVVRSVLNASVLNAYLSVSAPDQPVPQDAQQPVAWMTADGRVATDETKQIMPNASKVVFNIPLYDHRKE